jgi:hypothetical protein
MIDSFPDRLVDGVVALVASGEQQFCTLLDVQHHRDRDARRPASGRPGSDWRILSNPS